MDAPDLAHQLFNKYEQYGPYHWHQMRWNLKRFNAGLAARYEVSERILRNTVSNQIRSVVDVGCGDGYFTNRLAKMFPSASVFGFDFSKKGIEFARHLADSENASFFVEDAFGGQISKTDLLTATDVIEHVYDAGDFLRQCREHLSDKGMLFLSTPVKHKEIPDDPYHVHEFFCGELKALVEQYGFTVIEQTVSHDHALAAIYGRRHSFFGFGKMRIGKYRVNIPALVLGRNPFASSQCALPTMQYLLAVKSDLRA